MKLDQKIADGIIHQAMRGHDTAMKNGMTQEQFDACLDLALKCAWFQREGADNLTHGEYTDHESAVDFAMGANNEESIFASILDDNSIPYTPADGGEIYDDNDWFYAYDFEDKKQFVEEHCQDLEDKDVDSHGVFCEYIDYCLTVNHAIVLRIVGEIEEWFNKVNEKYLTNF